MFFNKNNKSLFVILTDQREKILVVLLVLFSFSSFSQKNKLCPLSNNSKANEYVKEAQENFKTKHDLDKLREFIEKATELDSSFAEPYIVLGDAAYLKKDWKTMKEAYIHLINVCPDIGAEYHYRLAYYLYETKKYDQCIKYFKSYLDFNSPDETRNIDARLKLFRANQYLHPVPFHPEVVKGLSTPDPEYLPIISPDNELCFFTRRFEMSSKNSLTPISVEKFMISHYINGQWEKGEPMEAPFNSQNTNNEGGATISIDNKYLYFTVNKNGNFDLYCYDLNSKGKGEIKNLGNIVNDPRQWDSQPSLAPDGKTLYFASFRDSVHKTSDIFKTIKDADGNWTKPERLPDIINTNGNEKAPFIHPDGKTLYFSSDSLPGMGGYDIFMSRMDDKGNWTTPVNLGYPINTDADEVGFFVSTDGTKGYFSSNGLKGVGGYDIYSFDLNPEVRPKPVLFISGRVQNEDNEIPLAASIELKNVATKEVTRLEYDTITGKYASVVLFDDDYILTVKQQGYAFASQYFAKDDTAFHKPAKVDMNIKKIKVGESYTLNNIYFETSSSELNQISKNVINDFADFLRQNPNVKVAIYGHTDNEGNAQKNLTLSDDRSKSVYLYLVSLGIDASRLSSKGFGETKPIADNTTEEGKAKNRRTEFFIVSK